MIKLLAGVAGSVLIASYGVGSFYVGRGVGYAVGYEAGIKHDFERLAENNAVMRKIGLCSWAKVMAAKIECKREFKPGEE
jgi:hypothetical protein